jgi:phosphoribosylanthranilate isomerase
LIGGTPGFIGVDVSSGVERAPADKDPDKIMAFVHAARAAGNPR